MAHQHKYKIITGYSIPDLEKNVNFFLAQPENEHFELIGSAQIFTHSEFVQTLEGYVNVN